MSRTVEIIYSNIQTFLILNQNIPRLMENCQESTLTKFYNCDFSQAVHQPSFFKNKHIFSKRNFENICIYANTRADYIRGLILSLLSGPLDTMAHLTLCIYIYKMFT